VPYFCCVVQCNIFVAFHPLARDRFSRRRRRRRPRVQTDARVHPPANKITPSPSSLSSPSLVQSGGNQTNPTSKMQTSTNASSTGGNPTRCSCARRFLCRTSTGGNPTRCSCARRFLCRTSTGGNPSRCSHAVFLCVHNPDQPSTFQAGVEVSYPTTINSPTYTTRYSARMRIVRHCIVQHCSNGIRTQMCRV